MKNIFYLTQEQVVRFKECGVGVKALTKEALQKYLTASDYRSIEETSILLQTPGNLLHAFGFEYNQGPAMEYVLNLPLSNSVLTAVCPNPDTIVFWLKPSEVNNTNDMIKESLLNIVSAMSEVLPFDVVKRTKSFAKCFVQNVSFNFAWKS